MIDDLSHLMNPERWESLQTIIKIDSERYIKSTQKIQKSTRYYISSLPCETKNVAESIRSHWKIENNLHWHLDVSFGEDKSRKRYKNAAQNFSSVLKLSLKILPNEDISPVKKASEEKGK